MEIKEVCKSEFKSIICTPYHCFNDAMFNGINEHKCDRLVYFLFKDKKFRLGLIAGIINENLLSSFSAPFGGYSYVSKSKNIFKYIEESNALLEAWCKAKNVCNIIIKLPPSFYDESFINKQINCFYRNGYEISSVDLNFHFINSNADNNYIRNLTSSARKFLNQSLRNNLEFYPCKTKFEEQQAFKIIKKNRDSKGFPLRMGYDDIQNSQIKKDFFHVRLNNDNIIAAAIVYYVSENVVQVVYWGDDPNYSFLRPMNFIAFKVFLFYKKIGVKYTDIGPSSSNSKPNYGLCEFKEVIGCTISSKLLLKKKL